MYMQKIVNPVIHEVENPVYQDYDEIIKQYAENLVVITNAVHGEYGGFKGGIVRYYGNDKAKILDKWQELGSFDKKAEYGKCIFKTLYNDQGVRFYYG